MSYYIAIIHVEPVFPKIQAGKRLWSTRWGHRQRIERQISWEACNLEGYWFFAVRKVSIRVSSYLSDLKLTGCARRYLIKILAYMGFRQRRPCIDVQRTPIYVCIVSHVTVCLDGTHRKTDVRRRVDGFIRLINLWTSNYLQSQYSIFVDRKINVNLSKWCISS